MNKMVPGAPAIPVRFDFSKLTAVYSHGLARPSMGLTSFIQTSHGPAVSAVGGEEVRLSAAVNCNINYKRCWLQP